MDAETRQDQLDLADARYPAPAVCDRAVEDVLLRLWESRGKPLQLGTAVRHAREMQESDSLSDFDSALVDVAVASLTALSNLRRLAPALTRKRR